MQNQSSSPKLTCLDGRVQGAGEREGTGLDPSPGGEGSLGWSSLLGGARPRDLLQKHCTLAEVQAALFGPGHRAQLGRLRMLDRIGSGASGVVYRAYDPKLQRTVAVKLLSAEASPRVPNSNILHEAQALARVVHPNVIAVHDVGVYNLESLSPDQDRQQGVYLVMEHVLGCSMQKWLQEAPRSWREVLSVFVQAGLGLAAAHRHQLVHRDFKPANVMVGEDGRVRVLDFGLAKAHHASPNESGASSQPPGPVDAIAASGTPNYMAPEQLVSGISDPQSDQYAFCVALYEALFGELPFRGELRVSDAGQTAGRSWVNASSSKGTSLATACRASGVESRPQRTLCRHG